MLVNIMLCCKFNLFFPFLKYKIDNNQLANEYLKMSKKKG